MLFNNLGQKKARTNSMKFSFGSNGEKRISKTINCRVISNRMQFRCSSCGAKRNLPVQANLRRKKIRCHKCGNVTNCKLNRRANPRESQSGKAVMITSEGKKIDVNIFDISMNGIGIEIPHSAVRSQTVSIGKKVRFECKWNPRLIGNNYFVVRNKNGQRIGLEKITQGVR